TPPPGTYPTGTDGVDVTIDASGDSDVATLPEGGGNSDYIAAVAAAPFDPADPTSFSPNHSLPINVYDSLGNTHQLMQYFAKRESTTPCVSQWDAYYRLDGQELGTPYDDAGAPGR